MKKIIFIISLILSSLSIFAKIDIPPLKVEVEEDDSDGRAVLYLPTFNDEYLNYVIPDIIHGTISSYNLSYLKTKVFENKKNDIISILVAGEYMDSNSQNQKYYTTFNIDKRTHDVLNIQDLVKSPIRLFKKIKRMSRFKNLTFQDFVLAPFVIKNSSVTFYITDIMAQDKLKDEKHEKGEYDFKQVSKFEILTLSNREVEFKDIENFEYKKFHKSDGLIVTDKMSVCYPITQDKELNKKMLDSIENLSKHNWLYNMIGNYKVDFVNNNGVECAEISLFFTSAIQGDENTGSSIYYLDKTIKFKYDLKKHKEYNFSDYNEVTKDMLDKIYRHIYDVDTTQIDVLTYKEILEKIRYWDNLPDLKRGGYNIVSKSYKQIPYKIYDPFWNYYYTPKQLLSYYTWNYIKKEDLPQEKDFAEKIHSQEYTKRLAALYGDKKEEHSKANKNIKLSENELNSYPDFLKDLVGKKVNYKITTDIYKQGDEEFRVTPYPESSTLANEIFDSRLSSYDNVDHIQSNYSEHFYVSNNAKKLYSMVVQGDIVEISNGLETGKHTTTLRTFSFDAENPDNIIALKDLIEIDSKLVKILHSKIGDKKVSKKNIEAYLHNNKFRFSIRPFGILFYFEPNEFIKIENLNHIFVTYPNIQFKKLYQ